jgi:hypothetical protein
MKNIRYFLLAMVLSALAGCGAYGLKSSSTTKAWEYKSIVRTRAFPTGNSVDTAVAATDWTQWYEDGQPIPAPSDPLAKVNQLGGQGWELITITPRSSLASKWTAGTTSDETWLFKRPKQ